MTTKSRQALAVAAFAAVVAAGITGATLRGETKETSLAAVCATADWPLIPAECLEGASAREVRVLSVAAPADQPQTRTASMAERFAVAFE